MTKDELGKVLDRLAVNCSRKWSSDKERELNIDNFYMGVGDLTEYQIMAGFKKVIRTPTPFMPDVGSFRELCLSGSGSQNLEDGAREAWATVLKIINRRGANYSPVFKDSAIAEAIRKMGGWKQLCRMETEDETWRKKDFIEYYLVAGRQKMQFKSMLRGTYEDYVFVGYDRTDNLKKIEAVIRHEESRENNILKIVSDNFKRNAEAI